MKIFAVYIVVAGVMVFFSAFAQAALIPIAITAEVTGVGDRLGVLEGNINAGDIITGVYIYDTLTPNLYSSPDVGRYEHYSPPCGITLTVGGFVFMTDPDNINFVVEIQNDILAIAWDYDLYRLESANNLPLSNGLSVDYFSLELVDLSASALSSAALPTTAPVLDHWYTGYADIRISGSGRGSFGIDGHLTSAVLIPEPATLALLGLGGLALVRRHKRSKKL